MFFTSMRTFFWAGYFRVTLFWAKASVERYKSKTVRAKRLRTARAVGVREHVSGGRIFISLLLTSSFKRRSHFREITWHVAARASIQRTYFMARALGA